MISVQDFNQMWHGRVHEQLFLDSMLLQPWIANAAPDTDGRSDDVLGWNDHVVFVLHSGQWIPAFKPEEVWQTTSLSETGLQCARRGY